MSFLLKRKGLLVAFAVSLALFCGGAVVGYSSISPSWAKASLHAGGAPLFGTSLPEIFIQNMSVALFLYSGVLTIGLTSVLSMGMVSVYVGATMAVGVTNGGLSSLVGDTGAYAGIEFLGVLLAATAGLHPLLTTMGRIFVREQEQTTLGAYVDAVRTSLWTLALSALLILLAASIEAAVIASR